MELETRLIKVTFDMLHYAIEGNWQMTMDLQQLQNDILLQYIKENEQNINNVVINDIQNMLTDTIRIIESEVGKLQIDLKSLNNQKKLLNSYLNNSDK